MSIIFKAGSILKLARGEFKLKFVRLFYVIEHAFEKLMNYYNHLQLFS